MLRDRVGLANVLAAAEKAAPVRSLDVVARNLRERFGARSVSFLFVDVVGRRLLRVSDEAAIGQERGADQVPLAGSSVYDEVLRTQKPVRKPHDGPERGQRVLAPSRTGATPSVSWSCSSPTSPTACWRRSSKPRTRWPTSSSPTAASPTSTTGATAPPRSASPRRSSASCCPRPPRARPPSSTSPARWSRPPTSPATPTTTPSTRTPCTCPSPTPWVTT